MEQTVLEWLKQIRIIKNLKIEDVVLTVNSMPQEELDYWSDINDNIIEIMRTFERPEAVKILNILMLLKSSYLTPLLNAKEDLLHYFARIHSNYDFLFPLLEMCNGKISTILGEY